MRRGIPALISLYFALTTPLDLATDVIENLFPLVTLSYNKADVIESENGVRHGTMGGSSHWVILFLPIGVTHDTSNEFAKEY
jgi:hypothetical protein